MAAAANATPLIALDAIVIDTETTGLDPAKARIVEIAAMRLAIGRLAEQDVFRRLVRPGEPIPESATRIHGIDQAAVANATTFAELWPGFAAYVGDGVLIGHSIGFDIAVLQRECARGGIAWRPGLSLDVGLLAQVVEPNLAGHSLDSLAAWLGIEIVGRHSALGDAAATARIFLALIPRLRERGIRTLAEAVRASSALSQVLTDRHRAGWAEPAAVQPGANNGPASPQIETFAYRVRAGDIMSAPVRSVDAGAKVGSALDIMTRERISSVLVAPSGRPFVPDELGIITERDVLRLIGKHGAAALTMRAADAMSAPLKTVPAAALAYLAIGRMNRLKLRHLGVTGQSGEVVGMLSARDLLRLRNEGGIELGDEIGQARDVHELGLAWAKAASVARDLQRDGLSGREIAAVISHQLCETTRRAAELAERAMKDGGQGSAPCRYAFVVLGSAGRGESLLAMDQDNALIYEDAGLPDADAWFAALSTRVADTLNQAGVPYCTGGIMAKNPQWRGSLADWRARVSDWIGSSNPEGLLAVDIFFDMRGVHGDLVLADTLWRSAFDAADGNAHFAKLLAGAAGSRPSAFGWFGGLRAEHGRIDLKRHGLFPIVSASRALAICHHVTERSTPARIAGVKALGLGKEADLDALDEAHALFLDMVVRQQIEDIDRGRPPGNAIEVKRLSRHEKQKLRAALRSVEPIDSMVQDLLFKG